MNERISLWVERECLQNAMAEKSQGRRSVFLSRFLRVDPAREYSPTGLAIQGTLHGPGNRGYEQTLAAYWHTLPRYCRQCPLPFQPQARAAGDLVRAGGESACSLICTARRPLPPTSFRRGLRAWRRLDYPEGHPGCERRRRCRSSRCDRGSQVCDPDCAISAG